jgi:ribosome maturation factor RimP
LKDLQPMAAKLAPVEIVAASVAGLGYELVDFELSARGLMRVFIDKPDGIGVEDCANVSNHLSRVFLVEEIEFERLEVSSPGLDRPLKTLAHYQQYLGQAVKVRLSTMVEGRKRFDGVIEAVEGEIIVFVIDGDAAIVPAGKLHGVPQKSKRVGKAAKPVTLIRVPFESIDKTRLIPEL